MKQVDLGRPNRLLLFLFLLFAGLYFAREFLVPIALAVLFTMLMAGLANRMERAGLSRGWSSVICTLILLVLFSGSVYFITDEVVEFAGDVPALKQKMEDNITAAQETIRERWNISYSRQSDLLKSRSAALLEGLGNIMQGVLGMIADVVRYFVLITVYMFLMLLYRDKFKVFFLKIIPDNRHDHARDVMRNCMAIAEKYLVGKMALVVILFFSYAGGYRLIGLDHALFLALIAAALSIIPIVGTLAGGFIPVVMAFMTQSPAVALGALVVFLAAQIIENYVLTPLVVGSKVNLNPLFTIMSVILGGAVWGPIGMIVFIPFLAIVKIVCDNIPPLEPIGYLVGKDSRQPRTSFIDRLRKRFHRENGRQ